MEFFSNYYQGPAGENSETEKFGPFTANAPHAAYAANAANAADDDSL